MSLRALLRRLSGRAPLPRNLSGDRDLEWSWVAANLPPGPGWCLEVGPGGSPLGLAAALAGYDVEAVDLEPIARPYASPRIRDTRGDLLSRDFGAASFDLVLNVSSIEHFGLAGRYGATRSDPEADLAAMRRILRWMSPRGRHILTVPVGRDAVFPPLCRVYGEERLPRLLAGYGILRAAYWMKDVENRWRETSRSEALAEKASCATWDPLRNRYAIACFVLGTPEEARA